MPGAGQPDGPGIGVENLLRVPLGIRRDGDEDRLVRIALQLRPRAPYLHGHVRAQVRAVRVQEAHYHDFSSRVRHVEGRAVLVRENEIRRARGMFYHRPGKLGRTLEDPERPRRRRQAGPDCHQQDDTICTHETKILARAAGELPART